MHFFSLPVRCSSPSSSLSCLRSPRSALACRYSPLPRHRWDRFPPSPRLCCIVYLMCWIAAFFVRPITWMLQSDAYVIPFIVALLAFIFLTALPTPAVGARLASFTNKLCMAMLIRSLKSTQSAVWPPTPQAVDRNLAATSISVSCNPVRVTLARVAPTMSGECRALSRCGTPSTRRWRDQSDGMASRIRGVRRALPHLSAARAIANQFAFATNRIDHGSNPYSSFAQCTTALRLYLCL